MNGYLTRRAAVAACVSILAIPGAAHATMLLPGATTALTAADILADPVAVGDVEAFISQDWTLDDDLTTGTLLAAVVRNLSGRLDFYYQIINDATSIDVVQRNDNAAFAQRPGATVFRTDVFFRTDDAGLGSLGFRTGVAGATPQTAQRSTNGRVVGFTFGPLSAIDPGETSPILVIRTNAVRFINGVSTVMNGSIESVGTFQPATAPAPEPASLLLLGSAFAAAGYMARRRKKPLERT